MAGTYPVQVSNISPSTSEKALTDFFTFCGKIEKLDFNADSSVAQIYFTKPQAAKTALMLNGGTLDGNHLTVTSDSVAMDEPDSHHSGHTHAPYEQSDKPRAGIVAEILAKGYTLSDHVVHKAIEYDKQQGISTRFLLYIKGLDSAVGAKIGGPETTVSGKAREALAQSQARAKSIDEQHRITSQAKDYYARAIKSPIGQKVLAFYTDLSKQVSDVHEEAVRIAANEHEKEKAAEGTTSTPAEATAPPPT